jgi:hypothetical protein
MPGQRRAFLIDAHNTEINAQSERFDSRACGIAALDGVL